MRIVNLRQAKEDKVPDRGIERAVWRKRAFEDDLRGTRTRSPRMATKRTTSAATKIMDRLAADDRDLRAMIDEERSNADLAQLI